MDEEKILTEEPVEPVPEDPLPEEAAAEAESALNEALNEEEAPAPELTEREKRRAARKAEKEHRNLVSPKKKNQWKAWLYLLPALAILAVFTVWPIINTVRISFLEDYNFLTQKGGEVSFAVNFNNFSNVVHYRGFLTCMGNTMLLTVITVPVSTMLALLIAVGLNSIKWLKKVFQTIFFLPYVTNAIAIGMVFKAMFEIIGPVNSPNSVGIINTIIKAFGGNAVNWVNEGRLIGRTWRCLCSLSYGTPCPSRSWCSSAASRTSINNIMMRPKWTGLPVSASSGASRCPFSPR